MDKPIRIQRKRTKGWKMPKNTVYVGRGSIYGNPFKVKDYGRIMAIRKYENALLKNFLPFTVEDVKKTLNGKNLCCWCKEGDFCHADTLLEIANG